jgi:hypothetical protein
MLEVNAGFTSVEKYVRNSVAVHRRARAAL